LPLLCITPPTRFRLAENSALTRAMVSSVELICWRFSEYVRRPVSTAHRRDEEMPPSSQCLSRILPTYATCFAIARGTHPLSNPEQAPHLPACRRDKETVCVATQIPQSGGKKRFHISRYSFLHFLQPLPSRAAPCENLMTFDPRHNRLKCVNVPFYCRRQGLLLVILSKEMADT
jgi:hypothetical protein